MIPVAEGICAILTLLGCGYIMVAILGGDPRPNHEQISDDLFAYLIGAGFGLLIIGLVGVFLASL